MPSLERIFGLVIGVTLAAAAFGVGRMVFVVALNLLVVLAFAFRLFYDHAIAPLRRRIEELEARDDAR